MEEILRRGRSRGHERRHERSNGCGPLLCLELPTLSANYRPALPPPSRPRPLALALALALSPSNLWPSDLAPIRAL